MAGGLNERLGVVGGPGAYSRQGWIASSFTSTSCRASTTARPISGSRSRSPARPCATGRGWSPARRTRRSWTSPRSPSGCASCEAALVAGGHRPRGPPGAELAWDDVPRARRRRARDGRPRPARPALAAARGAAAGHRHAREPRRQRRGAARARLRGAHRPSRALARARCAARAPSRPCWPPATGCRSTPPRSRATTARARGPRRSSSSARAARRSSPPTPISPALAPRA